MIHVRTKIQTGISLIATHIHTRTTYTHTLFVAQVQATGWKEDLLSLATIVLSITSFSTQVFWQWEGRGGRHRPLLECEGWLLWVKPPTYCSWKGWCAGCNLCLDFCQLPLAVPIPESLHLSPWSSATGRADTAVWMLTSPGQALEANRTRLEWFPWLGVSCPHWQHCGGALECGQRNQGTLCHWNLGSSW